MKNLIAILISASVLLLPLQARRRWIPTIASSGSATTATDTFIRTDSNPISNPMSDGVSTWQSGFDAFNAIQIAGNVITGTTSAAQNGARCSSPSFTANQSVTVKITNLVGFAGVLLRIQGSADNRCYEGYCSLANSGATITLARITTAGSTTEVGIGLPITVTHGSGVAGILAIGDTVTWAVSGSTFSAYVNGVLEATRSDSTLASGQPGVFIYDIGMDLGRWSATTIP